MEARQIEANWMYFATALVDIMTIKEEKKRLDELYGTNTVKRIQAKQDATLKKKRISSWTIAGA